EKLLIASQYYHLVTGELNRAIEVLELLKQTYPRDGFVRNGLALLYRTIGPYEKAVEESREDIRLHPNMGGSYTILTTAFLLLNRFEEAKAIAEQAVAKKIDFELLHTRL